MIKMMLWMLFIITVLWIQLSLQQRPFQCGVPQVNSMTELIVNGYDTAPGDWPWHAAIYHKKGRSDTYACGGTLISEVFILTAAHCVVSKDNGYQLSNNRIFARLGVHNLDAFITDNLQQHFVERIYKLDNFTNKGLKNDIAIIELSTVVPFNDYIQPACISDVKDLTGQFGTAIGWGVTENDETSPVLKTTEMPVIDPLKCIESNRPFFGQTLAEGVFCAGYTNGTSVCNGDSGGGLFFKKGDAWYLGGIVSYSQSRPNSVLCYIEGYGAFTKIYNYLSWIREITKLQFLTGEAIEPNDDLRGNDFGNCDPVEVDASTKYGNYLPRNCGIYNVNRILKGTKANVFEFPWMAIMRYLNLNDMDYLCVGTLINNRYVLTAAHCAKSNRQPYQVRLGEHTIGQDRDCNENDDYRDCAQPVRDFGIQCIIRHQNYSGRTKQNNIALIRLDRDVLFEDHIQPICLPVIPSLRQTVPPRYIITGWGDKDDDRKSMTLLKATVPSADRSKCQEWMDLVGLTLSSSQLCVGGTDIADACSGDGGGPLGYSVRYNGMRFVQFGIVSFGSGCGSVPSIYTKVGDYMDWIMANMKP